MQINPKDPVLTGAFGGTITVQPESSRRGVLSDDGEYTYTLVDVTFDNVHLAESRVLNGTYTIRSIDRPVVQFSLEWDDADWDLPLPELLSYAFNKDEVEDAVWWAISGT